MPTYTMGQYQALTRAIATGALSVTYDGMTTTYRTLDDMLRVKRMMEDDLGITPVDPDGNAVKRTRQVRVATRKGF